MNKLYKVLLFVVWYVAIPSLITFMWFNVSLFIPASETIWSFFNYLTGEINVGYASDLEFVSVYIIGIILSLVLKYLVIFSHFN